MKKIMSKILIIFIIIVMMFEFSFSNNISYAMQGPDTETINLITNLIGGIVSILLWTKRIMATGIAWGFNEIITHSLAEKCGISDDEIFKGTEGQSATPFDVFFNKYKLFDVNFFNIGAENDIITNIKRSVAEWFYIMRTLAAIILLVILIYVGIRMAISSVADDKAKYKRMLWDWCCSLALIFVLQYIALFTIYVNNALVNFLRGAEYSKIDNALADIATQATLGMGIGSIVATFVYCMITFQTIAFMITYIQRMLKVGFLIIISPLISLTYSIDKIGDGKAQALDTWLKEFVYTILIQPFHCIMYLAFVNTAIRLLNMNQVGLTEVTNLFATGFNELVNGFFVILCLKFINDGEQVIRKIFNFKDDASMTSMAAGMAVGMAAVANAKKIGSGTAKAVNTGKSFATKFAKSVEKDKGLGGKLGKALEKTPIGKGAQALGKATDKLKNSKVAQGIGNGMDKAAGMAGKLGSKIGGRINKFKKGHPGFIKGAKTLGNKAKLAGSTLGKVAKKSMPGTMALMGAAMMYSTGQKGALDAFTTGTALKKGSEAYFASSENTLENQAKDPAKQQYEENLKNNEEYQNTLNNIDEGRKKSKDTNNKLKDVNKNIKNLSKNLPDKGNGQQETLKDFEQKRAKIEQRKKSGNKKQRRAAFEDERKLRSHSRNSDKLYDALNEREELNKILANQDKLIKKKEEIEKETAKAVQKSFKSNGGAEQMEKAKSDIKSAILTISKLAKNRDEDGVDSDENFELSDEEASTAKRMQKSIIDMVDRSIIGTGASFDAAKFVKDNFDGEGKAAENLVNAIETYQFHKRASEYNSTRSNAGKLGVDSDKFDKDIFHMITGLNDEI